MGTTPEKSPWGSELAEVGVGNAWKTPKPYRNNAGKFEFLGILKFQCCMDWDFGVG